MIAALLRARPRRLSCWRARACSRSFDPRRCRRARAPRWRSRASSNGHAAFPHGERAERLDRALTASARPTSSSASSSPPGPTSSAARSRATSRDPAGPMAPFPQAEARATVEARSGKPSRNCSSKFGEPVAAASIAQVHKAEVDRPDGAQAVAVKVLRPGVERRFRATSKPSSSPRACERSIRRRGGCGRSRWSRRWRARWRSRWICGWRPPRFPRWRRTPPTIPASACRRSTGSAPRATC
jgi:hypothetical protein